MCFYCKGEMKQSKTVFTMQYGNCLIVIKNVPCMECEQCGNTEISDEVMKRIELIVNDAQKMMQEISIIDYSKVA